MLLDCFSRRRLDQARAMMTSKLTSITSQLMDSGLHVSATMPGNHRSLQVSVRRLEMMLGAFECQVVIRNVCFVCTAEETIAWLVRQVGTTVEALPEGQ